MRSDTAGRARWALGVPGEHAETIALLLLTVILTFAVVRRRGLPEAWRRSGPRWVR